MKIVLFAHGHLWALVIALAIILPARADEHLDVLTVGIDTYTNVTVTSVSATDIFFTHSRGMGNAKLKNLDPALQIHFGYNVGKAATVETNQARANAQFQHQLVHPPAPVRRPAAADNEQASPQAPAPPGDDFVAPQLYAKSVRGQPAPELEVEHWLTDRPDTNGKFMLIDFWATWCGPCRRSIPELNAFAARFKDRLVVIGVSGESEAEIRKMTDPHIDYAVASDTQKRMSHALEVKGIPHCILVDPHGIVRYEGMPTYLDDDTLEHFLDKYGR
jgi:thiol-disulfide isomerase/thioredoxin